MARRKFHKIKIHPNRYLIWTIAVMFIVAAALVSYISISNINLDAELASGGDMEYWHTYKDANISLRYPAEWLVDPGTGYIGFGPKNTDLFLLYSYSPPNDPAYEAFAKMSGVKKITVDGLEGIRIANSDKTNQKIAFVKTSRILYEFRGSTPVFDEILTTVRFLKK